MGERIVYVYRNGRWQKSRFFRIRKGDLFRMFESPFEPIIVNGCSMMKAKSYPYTNGDEWSWSIDLLPLMD
jgi:hypothetical protein